MKKLGDLLVDNNPCSEIVIGNTAVVRAMVESGTRVVSAYPGSPTPEIATAIQAIPAEQRPFYFEYSTNEKVALEVAFGASVNGRLSCVFFKSVGLNVASDSFMQVAQMELIGGMVIIIGDDPGANSSQNEQDNRHFARMTYCTMFEPADPPEAYKMYLDAARLSLETRKPVILRLTTHVCHAKQRIHFQARPALQVDDTPRFSAENGPYIPITSRIYPMKQRALENQARVRVWGETWEFNRLVDHGNRKRGVITTGLPGLSLLDVLEGTTSPPDILSLGLVNPLPTELLDRFLRSHDEVLVLEELDDIIEKDVKTLAFERGIPVRVQGKAGLEDWMGEYTPEKVQGIVSRVWPDLVSPAPEPRGLPVPRPPQMCPGCGHRSAFFAVKKALAGDDITVGDIGCHTLGFLEPYRVGEVLLSMGHSCGTAAGLALFNDSRKVVAFLGDSTLFHAGLPGIVNAVFNKHNFTLIVMENGTTAMTGHQDHPGSGRNFNEPTEAISIQSALTGLGVTNIRKVDAYSVSRLVAMLKEAVGEPGFKVIIASHPCMLKKTREQRRAGTFAGKMVQVNQLKCTLAHTCVEDFACPTFQRDGEGRITTHEDLCIGDGSCIQTCPSSAITPPKSRD